MVCLNHKLRYFDVEVKLAFFDDSCLMFSLSSLPPFMYSVKMF